MKPVKPFVLIKNLSLRKAPAVFSPHGASRSPVAQVSWESAPGVRAPTLGRFREVANDTDKQHYHEAMSQLLFPGHRDLVAEAMGLPVVGQLKSWGAYEGNVNPGTQISVELPNPQGRIDPHTHKQISAYASALGHLTNQDAMAWHRPYFDGNPADENGVSVDIGRPFSKEETLSIYAATQKLTGHSGFPPIASPEGARFLSFEGDNKAFQDMVHQAVNHVFLDHPGIHPSLKAFESEGDYIDHDWSKGEDNNEGYHSRLREAGRSDLYRNLERQLRQRIAGVKRSAGSLYGWSPRFDVEDEEGVTSRDPSTARKEHLIDHYSPHSNLSVIDPAFMGSAHAGAERAREDKIPRSYAYSGGTIPEPMFLNDNITQYRMRVPLALYDTNKDTAGYSNRLEELGMRRGTPAHVTAQEKMIAAGGWDGILNPERPDTVQILRPIRVNGDGTGSLLTPQGEEIPFEGETGKKSKMKPVAKAFVLIKAAAKPVHALQVVPKDVDAHYTDHLPMLSDGAVDHLASTWDASPTGISNSEYNTDTKASAILRHAMANHPEIPKDAAYNGRYLRQQIRFSDPAEGGVRAASNPPHRDSVRNDLLDAAYKASPAFTKWADERGEQGLAGKELPGRMDSDSGLLELAHLGSEAKGWYKSVRDAVTAHHPDPHVQQQLLGLFGALGQKTRVIDNYGYLHRAWGRFVNGLLPDSSTTDTLTEAGVLKSFGAKGVESDNLMAALTRKPFKTAKLMDYAMAIMGDKRAVPADDFMLRAVLGQTTSTQGDNAAANERERDYISGRVNHIADLMGIHPAEAQAMIWVGYKRAVSQHIERAANIVENDEHAKDGKALAAKIRNYGAAVSNEGNIGEIMKRFGVSDEHGQIKGMMPIPGQDLVGKHVGTLRQMANNGDIARSYYSPLSIDRGADKVHGVIKELQEAGHPLFQDVETDKAGRLVMAKDAMRQIRDTLRSRGVPTQMPNSPKEFAKVKPETEVQFAPANAGEARIVISPEGLNRAFTEKDFLTDMAKLFRIQQEVRSKEYRAREPMAGFHDDFAESLHDITKAAHKRLGGLEDVTAKAMPAGVRETRRDFVYGSAGNGGTMPATNKLRGQARSVGNNLPIGSRGTRPEQLRLRRAGGGELTPLKAFVLIKAGGQDDLQATAAESAPVSDRRGKGSRPAQRAEYKADAGGATFDGGNIGERRVDGRGGTWEARPGRDGVDWHRIETDDEKDSRISREANLSHWMDKTGMRDRLSRPTPARPRKPQNTLIAPEREESTEATKAFVFIKAMVSQTQYHNDVEIPLSDVKDRKWVGQSSHYADANPTLPQRARAAAYSAADWVRDNTGAAGATNRSRAKTARLDQLGQDIQNRRRAERQHDIDSGTAYDQRSHPMGLERHTDEMGSVRYTPKPPAAEPTPEPAADPYTSGYEAGHDYALPESEADNMTPPETRHAKSVAEQIAVHRNRLDIGTQPRSEIKEWWDKWHKGTHKHDLPQSLTGYLDQFMEDLHSQ